MRSDKALLIDVGAGGTLSTELRAILDPHFRLDLVVQKRSGENREAANSADDLDEFIEKFDPVLIFVVLSADFITSARKLLKSIGPAPSHIPIIMVVDAGEPTDMFELLKLGAADFITSPLKTSEVLPRAWRLMRQPDGRAAPTQVVRTELKQLVGESLAFLTHVNRIPAVAKCEANVLIAGETGTGKELYSRAIHYNSPRSGKPFIPVNCGAIPVELVENELFGHERGAFTSASTLQIGLIEEANGGTLFLDEIDCLPVYAQVKLLRFLQEKEYRPLGSTKMRRANVRIIAASNVDLEEAVEHGKIRQDLFYRLNTISLTLPPLRERREDIPLLARHFVDKYSRGSGKEITEISREALHLLMVQHWRGNVRELEHVIEQAIILCDGPILHPQDLVLPCSPRGGRQESLRQAKAKEIARFEKSYIQGLLSACRGNITRAAQVAQKNRRAFWQLIQKHQIDVSRFKPSVD
jgi:two-component system response regulator GlrR